MLQSSHGAPVAIHQFGRSAESAGPPGTNYAVMKKAFQEGWGGVVAKTVSLDSSKVVNVTPRYAKMRGSNHKDVRRRFVIAGLVCFFAATQAWNCRRAGFCFHPCLTSR